MTVSGTKKVFGSAATAVSVDPTLGKKERKPLSEGNVLYSDDLALFVRDFGRAVLVPGERPLLERSRVFRGKDIEGLPRTVLLSPSGDLHILLTKCKRAGDRLLGKGAFGSVKMAVSPLEEGVPGMFELNAVKICRPPEEEKEKESGIIAIREEIRVMEALKEGRQILQIKASHCEGSGAKAYIITEFCNGGDLREILWKKHQEKTAYEETALLSIAKECAEGVLFMHEKGWIHRDLKPENILLTTTSQKDQDLHVKIGDFGSAVETTNTQECRQFRGTPGYMAPESFLSLAYGWETPESGVTTASDVWALGCIYYELFHNGHHSPESAEEHKEDPLYIADLTARWKKRDPLSNSMDVFFRGLKNDVDADALLLIEENTPKKFHELLKGMLNVDPKKRFTMEQVKERLNAIQ